MIAHSNVRVGEDGMAPATKKPASDVSARRGTRATSNSPAVDSPDLRKLIQDWVWKRFGLVGLVVLAGVGLWWQWDHIIKLPGIEPLVARITRKALPKTVAGKFNIAIAHLEGDDRNETERLIRESLA